MNSNSPVPNRNSTLSAPYRIAIIGAADSADDIKNNSPFTGQAGRLLTQKLDQAGIIRDACFLGNIRNDSLADELARFRPNICILLGEDAFSLFYGRMDLSNWRGSILTANQPNFSGYKILPTYHPSRCLRVYEWLPILALDIRKAKTESTFPEHNPPHRDIEINLPYELLLERLDEVIRTKPEISPDIEGYVWNVTCCSIATSASKSFVVPFTNMDGSSYWQDPEQEMQVWKRFAAIMADEKIGKCWQNGLYDRFVLQYGFNIYIAGNRDDTMLKFWEYQCELEKSLAFQASVLTKEPYYKAERKIDNRDTHYRYCGKDGCVTYEINKRLDTLLDAGQRVHYMFNIANLNPMLYMELRGIRYNSDEAGKRLSHINELLYGLQFELDSIAKVGLKIETPRAELLRHVQAALCQKRSPTTPLKNCDEAYAKCHALLLSPTPLTKSNIGFMNIATECSMNIKSPKFKHFIYNELHLSPQYKEDSEGNKRLTTDGEALLRIQKKQPHPSVDLAIQIAELRTRAQMLGIFADPDGRVRTSYNIVGTVTGRISSSTSPTGSGYNLQTIPDDYKSLPEGHPLRQGMRDLFLADEGCFFFQCDLKGSDGWTIGAHMKALGDSNMIDDLLYGIKPASRICYMLRHGNYSLTHKPRNEVKELLKEIKKDDWDYFACKVGIWGICYLMGPDLLASQIAEESYGKIWLSREQVRDFQAAVFTAYNVKLWHSSMGRQLQKKPELLTSYGYKRRFFARPTDVLGQALAHEPQANTTYATNLAANRLWSDKENRITLPILRTNNSLASKVRLRIEPLHQVHDALLGQFRISDTAWAIDKIKSYFNNTITIANQKIVIPFEGNYGVSWGDLSVGTI